jgi:hypothetical protein
MRRKAGRVLSAQNEADLRAAAEHAKKAAEYHEKALEAHHGAAVHAASANDLISGVLARHDANESSGEGPDAFSPPGEDAPEGAAPLVMSLRERALSTLAVAREADDRT